MRCVCKRIRSTTTDKMQIDYSAFNELNSEEIESILASNVLPHLVRNRLKFLASYYRMVELSPVIHTVVVGAILLEVIKKCRE